jgi:transposase
MGRVDLRKEAAMACSYSSDLRGRVLGAISQGASTRAAARRFGIGISTAGNWYRRFRASGETGARKQGHPPGSKLDAHDGFILGLVEECQDITLVEIAGRLRAERAVSAAPSTIWEFFKARGITFKKRRHMPASNSAPM